MTIKKRLELLGLNQFYPVFCRIKANGEDYFFRRAYTIGSGQYFNQDGYYIIGREGCIRFNERPETVFADQELMFISQMPKEIYEEIIVNSYARTK